MSDDTLPPPANPRRLARRSSLALWLVLAIGLLLLLEALTPHLLHLKFNYSEPVRAQVIESRLEAGTGWLRELNARPVFRYRYVHRGEWFAGSGFRPSGGQAEAARRYASGDMLTVWIDPERPERALIHPDLSRRDCASLALGLLLLAVAAVGLWQHPEKG